jgi:nitrate/nitrite transporter NarK
VAAVAFEPDPYPAAVEVRRRFRRAPKHPAPILERMPRAAYLAVLGAGVLCYAALGAVLRILPELVDNPAALGLLVGAPALTAVVTRPAGGRVADRVGAAPVMLAGAVVMAAGVAPALAAPCSRRRSAWLAPPC